MSTTPPLQPPMSNTHPLTQNEAKRPVSALLIPDILTARSLEHPHIRFYSFFFRGTNTPCSPTPGAVHYKAHTLFARFWNFIINLLIHVLNWQPPPNCSSLFPFSRNNYRKGPGPLFPRNFTYKIFEVSIVSKNNYI